MRWVLKWAVQKTISFLPNSQSWNYLFQKWITKSLVPGKADLSRHFGFSAQHLAYYEQVSGSQQPPSRILELGTGWMPTVCVGLWLCGVDEIHTIDIQDLKKAEVIAATLKTLCSFSPEELAQVMPRVRHERFERVKKMIADCIPSSELFAQMGLHFIVGDASRTPFAPESIDFMISNATLEHIPRDVILSIFQEFRRIAAPGAVMSHLVDESDHYSHFDPSVSPYQFLYYEKLPWKLINNSILYMNRLRVNDYREIHRLAHFTIVREVNQDEASRLDRMKLAQEFRLYAPDDLVPIESWFVSRPV